MNKVKKAKDEQFEDFENIKENLRITKSMMIQVFEDKKGLKVSEMLKSLPI